MNRKIKLGPLAIFLAIITIILVMLALLNHTTANADVVLAERYAEVTQIKYDLEKEGAKFLKELDGGNPQDLVPLEGKDGIYSHIIKNGDYSLTIDFTLEGDGYQVKRWQIHKEWEETNQYENILH